MHQFRRWAGVDRAVFFSNAAQMTRLITSPLTMVLVLRYLTPEIQGYFYAFSGVVAMQVFLEMGFSQNILQFASHEYSKLRFTAGQTLDGDPGARSRLVSLARLSFRYYSIAALIFLLAVGIGGQVYFKISSDRFSEGSFRDLPAFAAKLAQPSDPVSKLVYEHLPSKTQQELRDYVADPSKAKTLPADLSEDFNTLVNGGSLYEAAQAAGVKLSAETVQLAARTPEGRSLVHLNRLLLEDAFPREIAHNRVAWEGAWWLIAVAAALALAINPAWSLLQGCNQVAQVAKFNFWAALAVFGANAIALISGAGVYASAVGAAFSVLLSMAYLLWRWRPFFRQFLERPQHGHISWRHEIWPFQWRIAVSWMSGYFVFDILNPIALYFCGPVDAGRLGMSLQLVNTIARVAQTWINTKAPRFGMLIAARAWQELDALWRRSTIQAFAFYLLGYGSFLAAIWLIGQVSFLATIPQIGPLLLKVPARLAPLSVIAWLGGAQIAQVLVNCMAGELRAHKREPYVWIAVATAVLSVAFMFPLVRIWGIHGEAIGYAAAIWAVLIPAWIVYRSKRLEYRSQANALSETTSTTGNPGPESATFS